jgi:hypothetical protein
MRLGPIVHVQASIERPELRNSNHSWHEPIMDLMSCMVALGCLPAAELPLLRQLVSDGPVVDVDPLAGNLVVTNCEDRAGADGRLGAVEEAPDAVGLEDDDAVVFLPDVDERVREGLDPVERVGHLLADGLPAGDQGRVAELQADVVGVVGAEAVAVFRFHGREVVGEQVDGVLAGTGHGGVLRVGGGWARERAGALGGQSGPLPARWRKAGA